jgi:hypothetical protein
VATSWDPNPDALVSALAISGSTIYAGGNFTTIGGQLRNDLAALDAGTGQASPWNPSGNGGVSTLAVGNVDVFAGGRFTSVDDVPQSYVAAIESTAPTGVEPHSDPSGVRVSLACAPNPFGASARIRYRLPNTETSSLALYDVRGRLVRTLLPAASQTVGWHELPLEGRGLPAGVYLCRLRVGSRVVATKVRRLP